jgi:hypothetical protein
MLREAATVTSTTEATAPLPRRLLRLDVFMVSILCLCIVP